MPPSGLRKAVLGRYEPVARRLNYPQPVFNLKILAAISNTHIRAVGPEHVPGLPDECVQSIIGAMPEIHRDPDYYENS